MKKAYIILAVTLLTISISAKDLTGIKFYVNPGHGSFGTGDRPAATIPFPNLKTTGMPDTCGFYESNTNLWKCLYLGEKLEAAGATVLYSRTQCGPWPYIMVNGDYPDYTWEEYKNLPDYQKYNRDLVEICEEVEANNIDYFISVHSNANTEGSTTNFPLMLYRGPDDRASANATDGYEYVEGSYEKAKFCNEEKLKIMKAGIDVPSSTALNIRGDWDFYGSTSNRTHANGKTYKGFLGVLKHGASGFLSEGYFHTYQPARHRALNQDYCHMEGLDYYRGIINYYGADKETVGYIVGTVKDQYNKMSHKLYTYTPKSNDQWVPCNGAEVILKKGGVEVARYNVDTLYNGIFVFEGLEPGDDYSLDANCEGFFPLDDQYKVPFSVKANETTYPMIYLVDTTWTPPTIVYEDYPNPDQPAYLGLPSAFEMTEQAVRDYTEVIKGTVKRTLQSGDSTILLSHEEDGTPHIYLIKSSLNTIETISTDSLLPRDPDNLGDYLALSDIALTCDGKLVGVNYVRCQYSDDQVDAGYKRGTKYFYIWDKLAGDARIWFTAQNSANSYRSDVGYTLAVAGKSTDCQVLVSARHYNASSGGGSFRYSCYNVTDGIPSYIFYGYSISLRENPVHDGTRDGENIQFTLSPRGEKKDFIMDADKVTPNEFRLPGGQNEDPTPLGQISADLMHVKFNGATYFKYAGKALMAAPTTDADGKVTGVQVLDITDGLDVAKVIKTTNTTLAEPVEATYAAATAKVKGADLYLYLLVDGKIYSYTTVGVAQAVVPAIVAYNLNVVAEGTNYVFTFDANADAVAAELVFYAAGEEVGTLPVEVVKGANAITVPATQLPGSVGQELTWAVKLDGGTIANFGIIASEGSLIESSTSRLFNAVSTNPELDNFGKIYIMHRAGSSTSANAPKSGIWEFDHNLIKQNTEVYKGGLEKFCNPGRMSIDRDGYLYATDWSDEGSGIYVSNTANMNQPFTQFFAGTRESNGAFNNGGVYTGSSTPGCYVYDNGEEVKLFVYNEDAKGTLPANGMAVYNIGQEDGTILHAWETAPSAVYTLTGQANTEGNPWGTSHGFFVSQVRTSGNNNSGATSLKFYSNDGTEQMSAASDEYKEIITGSNAGGYVVSADESVMVFNDGDMQFLVFDITWEGDKPVMALRYTIKHGISAIRQMNWDYAGNIICSGDAGIHIVSLPKEENVTVVPAKKALTVFVGHIPSPTITYELNGGVTNDYGWMSKGDMFTACITDALGYDLGMTLDEFKRSNTPFDDLFVFFNVDHCQNILDNARWDWLEDYLITIQEEDQLAVPLTKGVASKDWRYAIAAFFFESQYDTSSDYSQAGKDEAYIPYWKHGYDNPTQPTKEWVLNAPYKENYLFDGWYATNTFTDEPITTVNASTNGTLYAKWKNEIVSSDTVGICFYDTYYWDINDEIYDRTGTYYATDEEGKHVLHLTVYPLTEDVEIFDTIRAGEIYDFEGRELTQTGTYYEAMLDDNGCDYTITLHLTVVHEEYVNICQGETYTWAVNSQIYSETGTYNLTTNDGIFILHLTVNPLIYTEETITTCDSYQWNGQTYTQSGDYTYTTTATNGCDSTITLHLTINQTQYAEETITACDSYTWNGQTYTQSGDYTYSTTAINGCDSIATLHLLVYQSKHTEEHITACDNYEWNGQTYTESGTYTHTSTTIDGCDSIVTLHLTINYSEVGETENVTICHGETYTWNGQTYSTAGEYSVTLSNTNGCDSTATLHLTIMPQAQEEVQYETINKKETPFIWQKNGKKYYETTTDSIFIPYTHHDCDSMIYILDLTVVDIEDVRAEYDTICESALPYEWHGQSITTGGRYEYTEKYGDTNIDILNVLYLTVIPTIRTQQSATICYEETFAWNGNTYSQTGTYTYTTEATNGCDSVVTLYLTVLPQAITIYTDTMIAHADLPYIWRGQYCDTSGEYTATIPFAANTACDSVIYVLNLTVESVNKCGADLSWEYDNGILTISGSGAMYDNPDLQSYRNESWYPYRVRQVILSDQLTHIGNVAFADCTNLTSIKIPSSVTSIGDGAFSWTGLQAVTIPASVTELGEQVFETCNNLHTILYEGYPSVISNQTVHPFIGCVHLDTIITPAELWHCTSADPVLENRYGVPHKARYIEVTDGFLTNQAMKYIAKNATTLKVLDLTYATNTTLPYGALSDSYQLSTLYLPQQMEVIPESMIEGGRNLTEILIPATVTEIGNYAFAGCTNVWRMTVEAILPPKAYDKTFDGIDRSISLIVPAGSEDLYRQAEYWREFFIEPTNSPSPISNCQKLLHEDHILILREGKVYTTMGQLINVGE